MRAYEKKKLYRLFIKRQVRDGRINNAEGAWVSPSGVSGSMPRDLAAGHRVGRR